ncbi:MAG: nitrous oxide reductase accessory protein NosL [Pseudomonadota bacterium]
MRREHTAWRFILSIIFLSLAACSGQPDSGPVEIKWDRDVCARCSMVLSDRLHSAQVRATPVAGKRSKVYKFDDIGCAVLWIEDKPWRNDPKTEIWVNDHRNGKWIDARSAYYVSGQVTPMEYGLGAQSEPAENALNYEQARQQIFELEARFNTHNIHLKESASDRHNETGERQH